MMINRIKKFNTKYQEEIDFIESHRNAIVAQRKVIDAQNDVITEFRWNLFVAKRNARIWFWLWVATVAASFFI